ncbi:MAG TPA: hypothetical protein VF129_01130 [Actinomycetota bacterium]
MKRVIRAATMAVGATVALGLAPSVGATVERGAEREAEQGAIARVRILDNRFRPRVVTVRRGTKVRWANAGRRNHTVTADDRSFDSGLLAPGDRFARRFRRTGTFTYHCTVHPRMTGTSRWSDSLTGIGCQVAPRAALTVWLAASTMPCGEGRLVVAPRALTRTCP